MKIELLNKKLLKMLPRLEFDKKLHLSQYDVIIHAPGFEDRTLAIKDYIFSAQETKAILLMYSPHNAKNRLIEVKEELLKKGVRINENDIIVYDRFDPSEFEIRLSKRLGELNIKRAIVDISTMSKLAIMLVLNVCHRLSLEVCVIYTEAKFYRPTREEFTLAKRKKQIHQPSLKIYTGIHGVVRVNSLASVAMQGQPTAALVFMSLNDALTQVLLNTVYPSRLLLINGKPPELGWREAATAWIHEQVRSEWQSDNPVYLNKDLNMELPKRVVSTLDYRETVSLLINLYWLLSNNHRILLAPAGSKMQTIGCYIIKALHPDIHIEYPSPEGFLLRYSSGIGKRWYFELGRIDALLEKISNIEYEEYIEM